MSTLAIIGGTGLSAIKSLQITRRENIVTPYGDTSAELIYGEIAGKDVIFLPRHGEGHTIPPHEINYRANIWALKSVGVKNILAIAAVGGIRTDLIPGAIVIPDQLIDYTYSRQHTYSDKDADTVKHIDFTWPYCESLRERVMSAANQLNIDVSNKATYAVTQGPRLETAAEINRLEGDGADIVGMSGMPEAALARELDICYACCAVIANEAAGRGQGEITLDEIEKNLIAGMQKVERLLDVVISDSTDL